MYPDPYGMTPEEKIQAARQQALYSALNWSSNQTGVNAVDVVDAAEQFLEFVQFGPNEVVD